MLPSGSGGESEGYDKTAVFDAMEMTTGWFTPCRWLFFLLVSNTTSIRVLIDWSADLMGQ